LQPTSNAFRDLVDGGATLVGVQLFEAAQRRPAVRDGLSVDPGLR
jgi:hypothetical protein